MPRRPEPSLPDRDPATARFLEEAYARCGAAGRLRRDPLAVVARYPDPVDRGLAGLVCSTLAFGGVDLILRACEAALAPLGDAPARRLAAMGDTEIREAWSGFQYRYCFGRDMTALMRGARRALEATGSLEDFFLRGDPGGADVVAAASSFARRFRKLAEDREGGLRENLLPDPARGSACKRLFLWLRWMGRRDAVDPGGWEGLDPARLVVPLDTHMTRVCLDRLRFIERPTADLRNALRATAAFRLYAPEDPVKYDFALTRPGIDPEPGDEPYGSVTKAVALPRNPPSLGVSGASSPRRRGRQQDSEH